MQPRRRTLGYDDADLRAAARARAAAVRGARRTSAASSTASATSTTGATTTGSSRCARRCTAQRITCIDAAILPMACSSCCSPTSSGACSPSTAAIREGEECGHCVTLYWSDDGKVGSFSKSSFEGSATATRSTPTSGGRRELRRGLPEMGFKPLYFGVTTLEEVAPRHRLALLDAATLNVLSERIQARTSTRFMLPQRDRPRSPDDAGSSPERPGAAGERCAAPGRAGAAPGAHLLPRAARVGAPHARRALRARRRRRAATCATTLGVAPRRSRRGAVAEPARGPGAGAGAHAPGRGAGPAQPDARRRRTGPTSSAHSRRARAASRPRELLARVAAAAGGSRSRVSIDELADARARRRRRPSRRAAGADELAIVLYTSGTTGNPKGVGAQPAQPPRQRLEHGARTSASTATTQLAVLPLYHAHALRLRPDDRAAHRRAPGVRRALRSRSPGPR